MMLRIAIALLSVVMLSCSTSTPVTSASADPSDPSGSYVLQTIDGHALPFRPIDRDRPPEAGPGPLVVGGSLVIEPGGGVGYVLNFRGAQGRDQAIRMNATWTRDGDQLVVIWPNGARTPATYDGRTFTIDNIGMKLAFARSQ